MSVKQVMEVVVSKALKLYWFLSPASKQGLNQANVNINCNTYTARQAT